jgi:hypothetical protein
MSAHASIQVEKAMCDYGNSAAACSAVKEEMRLTQEELDRRKRERELADKPELLLARTRANDLNVQINPMALRMFIWAHWERVSTLGRKIHDGVGQ